MELLPDEAVDRLCAAWSEILSTQVGVPVRVRRFEALQDGRITPDEYVRQIKEETARRLRESLR